MPALRRRQGPVRGGYGVGSGRNAPQGEHPRSRIADMGRIRRQAASPTCRRPSSTGWRVPFRHQKKGYPVGYPFLYAFVQIGEIPGVRDTGINARTGPAAMCFGARFRGFPHRRIRRLQKKGRYATSRPVIPVETRIRLSPRVSYRGDPHRPSRPDRLPCRACCRGTA